MTKIKTMTKPSTVKNGKQKLNSTDKKGKIVELLWNIVWRFLINLKCIYSEPASILLFIQEK